MVQSTLLLSFSSRSLLCVCFSLASSSIHLIFDIMLRKFFPNQNWCFCDQFLTNDLIGYAMRLLQTNNVDRSCMKKTISHNATNLQEKEGEREKCMK